MAPRWPVIGHAPRTSARRRGSSRPLPHWRLSERRPRGRCSSLSNNGPSTGRRPGTPRQRPRPASPQGVGGRVVARSCATAGLQGLPRPSRGCRDRAATRPPTGRSAASGTGNEHAIAGSRDWCAAGRQHYGAPSCARPPTPRRGSVRTPRAAPAACSRSALGSTVRPGHCPTMSSWPERRRPSPRRCATARKSTACARR